MNPSAAARLPMKSALTVSLLVHAAAVLTIAFLVLQRPPAAKGPESLNVLVVRQAPPVAPYFEPVRAVRADTPDTLPPASTPAPAEPLSEPVPLKFGMAPQDPATNGSTEAPVGNTLAAPPETGADADPSAAGAYAGGTRPVSAPPEFVPLGEVTDLPVLREFDAPVYPGNAWRSGREAVVRLEVDIASDGTVAGVRPAAGEQTEAVFLEAAMNAIRRAKFSPARRGEDAVAVRATLPVKFRLR